MKHVNKMEVPESHSYLSLIGANVVDRNGNKASIQSIHQENDKTIAVLNLDDGATFKTDLAQLERHREEFFLPSLFSRNNESFQHDSSFQKGVGADKDLRIPVQKEEIRIDKQSIDTGKGVRIKKHVTEHEEIVNLPRMEEILTVERVQMGHIVSEDDQPQARQEGDVYIIPVFEEVYVVEKKLRLKEEIHIVRKRKEESEEQTVKLKSEQVSIERFDETRHNR
jgi:uncharacterized protein (TIGR02271 family)